jgi:hypothetical protein
VRITVNGNQLEVHAATPITVALPAGVTVQASPGQPAVAELADDGTWRARLQLSP